MSKALGTVLREKPNHPKTSPPSLPVSDSLLYPGYYFFTYEFSDFAGFFTAELYFLKGNTGGGSGEDVGRICQFKKKSVFEFK